MSERPSPASLETERKRRRLRSKVQSVVRDVEERAAQGDRRRDRLGLFTLRIAGQVIRQWARDRCPQQAASLAFQTVMSLVPLLAVSLAAFRATGSMDAESTMVEFLSEKLIPVSQDEIATRLQSWSDNITFESLGILGLIGTVLLAFVMFNSVERTMNQIWRVEKRRSLAQRFVVFYATATIGPILFGTSLYHAARYGLTEGGFGMVISVAVTYAALFLANFFLPATPVQPRAAAIGAAVTTAASELAKFAFTAYVGGYAFDRYTGIYGAVAAAPIFLIWIYWSWLMLLLGAEVAHAAQNLKILRGLDRRGTLSLENELLQRVTGPMAARVMVAVAEAYARGDKTLSRTAIADRFDLSSDAVDRLLARLLERELLIEVERGRSGFVPGRPLEEITLGEILSAFRADDTVSTTAADSPLETILAEVERETDAATSAVTLASLVAQNHQM